MCVIIFINNKAKNGLDKPTKLKKGKGEICGLHLK